MSTEELRDNLERCVLCGGCKADCPTYYLLHKESQGPRGRLRLLRAVLGNELEPTDEVWERIFSCLLCGACADSCSAGVDIIWSLYEGRALLAKKSLRGLNLFIPLLLKKRRQAFRLFKLLFPLIRPYLIKKDLIEPGLGLESYVLSDIGTVFPPYSYKEPKGRVVLYKGCAVEFLYPQIGESFIRVANALGYEVVTLKGEQCCGAPLLGLGMLEEAKQMAMKNLETFKGLQVETMLSLCPTCVQTLKDTYRKLIGRSIEITDVITFLEGQIPVRDPLSISAFYHDPCHALYGLNQFDQPRKLLDTMGVKTGGDAPGCCGLAGTFSLSFREASQQFLKKRVNLFEKTRAQLLITACPGCLFQLSKSVGSDKSFHIIELVDEYLSGDMK